MNEPLFKILGSLISQEQISEQTIMIAAKISQDALKKYLLGDFQGMNQEDIAYLDELTMQLGPGRSLVSPDERVKGTLESLIDCYKFSTSELSRMFGVDEEMIQDILAGKKVDLYKKYLISVSASHLFYVLKRA